jgi:hypothetical protein
MAEFATGGAVILQIDGKVSSLQKKLTNPNDWRSTYA